VVFRTQNGSRVSAVKVVLPAYSTLTATVTNTTDRELEVMKAMTKHPNVINLESYGLGHVPDIMFNLMNEGEQARASQIRFGQRVRIRLLALRLPYMPTTWSQYREGSTWDLNIMPFEIFLPLMQGVAAAIGHLEHQGLVHTDLHLGNILLHGDLPNMQAVVTSGTSTACPRVGQSRSLQEQVGPGHLATRHELAPKFGRFGGATMGY
jgi:serine/threonine protein kinase